MVKHNSLDLTNITEGSGPNRRGWRPWQGCCPRTPRPSPPPTSEAALLQHTSKVMDTKVKNDGKKERETETPFVPVKKFLCSSNSAINACVFPSLCKTLYNHVMYNYREFPGFMQPQTWNLLSPNFVTNFLTR